MPNENYIDGKQSKASQKDEDRLKTCRSWSKSAKSSRTLQEVLWYEIQLFKDGDHWIKRDSNKSTGSTIRIQPIPRGRGEIQRTFNKFRALLRALKATATSTEIRFEVPGGSEDEVMGSNYLNWFTDKHDLGEVIADVVDYGFTRSVGYFDVYWDSVKASPVVMARDPFDVLMDRHGKYARRTYTMRKSDFVEAKDSEGVLLFKNTKKIPTTDKQSSSEIYNNYLQSKYKDNENKEGELGSVMVEEYHILEQKDDGKGQVRIITTVEGSDFINKEEFYDDDELRFIAYWPERRPGDIYNEPWMKDALDPQRSLDNMYTHMEEFIRTMGKGRFLKRKDGTTLDRITDKNGQQVEWSGEKPDYLEMGRIGNDQFNFDQKVEGNMEDVVGIHPSQIRKTTTAKGIGYLIAQDETNISEPFKNLKTSLTKVGKRLLKLSNKHMVASQDIFWWHNGERANGKVIGGEKELEGAAHIKNIDGLTVDLIPKGAFAALAREEKIMQLVQRGVITNPEVAMMGMNIGNVRELVDKEMAFRQQQAQQQVETPPAPNENIRGEEDLRNVVEELKSEVGL